MDSETESVPIAYHSVPGSLDEQPAVVPARSPSPNSIRAARLAALERKHTESSPASTEDTSHAQAFDEDYEKRLEFRRMIDPGIMRPNRREIAVRSLRTLSTLAQNLLHEPDNPKFHSFKPTNTVIKRDLVDPTGTLEYAVAMGFRPEVDNFQPYYKFHERHLQDLRIGASILLEAIKVQESHEQDLEANMKLKKEQEAARVELAKKQFIDDRRSKAIRDQRERARAQAQAEARAKAERAAAAAARHHSPEP